MVKSQKDKSKKHSRKPILWIGLSLLSLGVLALLLFYFLWLKPTLTTPLADVLNLPTSPLAVQEPTSTTPTQDPPTLPTEQAAETAIEQFSTGTTPDTTSVAGETPNPTAEPSKEQPTPTNTIEVPVYVKPTIPAGKQPICGDESEWIVLLAGVDYQGDGYLYGLADVIRLARIDFINGTINMLVLPRDLLVDVPVDRLKVEGPIKLNQGYLFGTPGMGHYVGSGYGAGSLAEVIQYNFGVTTDHYAVINFKTFVSFIDAIGGIEVDLPQRVTDPDFGTFPAGRQWLSGEQALKLARIRMLYSDAFRISNQTLIMRAVLNKMMQPSLILKVPALLVRYKDAFLTDLSIEQLTTLGLCFLNKFDTSNLQTYAFPYDLAREGSAFIPTLNNKAFVYNWDPRLIDWIHETLVSE
mgnify:CR=1 FL=1